MTVKQVRGLRAPEVSKCYGCVRSLPVVTRFGRLSVRPGPLSLSTPVRSTLARAGTSSLRASPVRGHPSRSLPLLLPSTRNDHGTQEHPEAITLAPAAAVMTGIIVILASLLTFPAIATATTDSALLASSTVMEGRGLLGSGDDAGVHGSDGNSTATLWATAAVMFFGALITGLPGVGLSCGDCWGRWRSKKGRAAASSSGLSNAGGGRLERLLRAPALRMLSAGLMLGSGLGVVLPEGFTTFVRGGVTATAAAAAAAAGDQGGSSAGGGGGGGGPLPGWCSGAALVAGFLAMMALQLGLEGGRQQQQRHGGRQQQLRHGHSE
ncbi:hypothetical protein Agub_g3610, partial [Astrephomene gubernaculifera]